jgi:hypothetical protein
VAADAIDSYEKLVEHAELQAKFWASAYDMTPSWKFLKRRLCRSRADFYWTLSVWAEHQVEMGATWGNPVGRLPGR